MKSILKLIVLCLMLTISIYAQEVYLNAPDELYIGTEAVGSINKTNHFLYVCSKSCFWRYSISSI